MDKTKVTRFFWPNLYTVGGGLHLRVLDCLAVNFFDTALGWFM